ncbi:hypothetical protein M0802_017027 [Mischocyttarus mexicanus]|nr:hypothetical protein M0802_017027 [Mischocyttarus mexicanus]
MNILRPIVGKTRKDRIRNTSIRKECDIQDIIKWGRVRRRNWDEHISRMDADRMVKAARDYKPTGIRPPGRPPKRWRDCRVSTSPEDPAQQKHRP